MAAFFRFLDRNRGFTIPLVWQSLEAAATLSESRYDDKKRQPPGLQRVALLIRCLIPF